MILHWLIKLRFILKFNSLLFLINIAANRFFNQKLHFITFKNWKILNLEAQLFILNFLFKIRLYFLATSENEEEKEKTIISNETIGLLVGCLAGFVCIMILVVVLIYKFVVFLQYDCTFLEIKTVSYTHLTLPTILLV